MDKNNTAANPPPDQPGQHRGQPRRVGVMLLMLTLYALPLGLVMLIQHAHLSRAVHELTAQRLGAAQELRAALLKERIASLLAYAEALAASPAVRRLGDGGGGPRAVEQFEFNPGGEPQRLRRLEIMAGARRILLFDADAAALDLIRLPQAATPSASFVSALGAAAGGLVTEVSAPLTTAAGRPAVLRMTVEGRLPAALLGAPAGLGASGQWLFAALDETQTPRIVLQGSAPHRQLADRDLWRMPIWDGPPDRDSAAAGLESGARFISAAAIPEYGLRSLALIDRAEVNAGTDRVMLVNAAILLAASLGFLFAVWRHVLKRLGDLRRGIAAEALRIFGYQPAHGDEVSSLSQLFRKILDEHQRQAEAARRQFAEVSRLLQQREADVDVARTLNGRMERELARVARFVELGEVAATVAHDINQPLTQMRLMIEASSLDPANQGGAALSAADVGKTQLLIKKITDITVNLRDLARERAQSRKEVMKAAQIVADALLLARLRVKSSLASVELAGDEGVLCAVDPVQIQQVLMNLVVNASDAFGASTAPEQRRIRVLWRELGGRVYFMIEDNGSGIPDEVKPKIFDWNFSTKGRDQGSGLGLAICRRIVEAHGGKIDVGDRAGGGAVFSFDVAAAAAGAS